MKNPKPGCRFVVFADVHYVVPPHPRLSWPQLVEKLPEQPRVTELIDTMLPMALEQVHAELRPDFIVYAGDQVNVGWDEEGLANQHGFRNLLAEASSASFPQSRGSGFQPDSDEVPVYLVYGNHDRPRERYLEFYGETIYSFTCNGCHFAVLDSGVMHPEDDYDPPEIFTTGLDELQNMLDRAAGAPAAVLLHFYIYPTDIVGYSYPAAAEAIAMIESYSRPVPVLNGHLHDGRVDIANGQLYFTARSFIESPFCFYLHELSEDSLQIDEYMLDFNTGRWSRYRMCAFDLSPASA